MMAAKSSQAPMVNLLGALLMMAAGFIGATAKGADAEQSQSGEAALPAPAKKKIEFDRDINPILTEHCIKCHGAKKPKN